MSVLRRMFYGFSLMGFTASLLIGLFSFLNQETAQAIEDVSAVGGWPSAVITPTEAISITLLGTYASPEGETAAEIVAYDPVSQTMYVVNVVSATIDVIDIADPTSPTVLRQIDVTPYGTQANSVAFHGDYAVAAVQNADVEQPGQAVFFDRDGNYVHSVTVGALPDMITFTPDGSYVLVANEGEPGATDPPGSVSIIDISNGVHNATVATADFVAWGGREAELRAEGIRIFPGNTVSQDVEPEYIAVSADSSTAFVTLQEANAFAVIVIASASVEDIIPLGLKDHSQGQPQLTQYTFENLPPLGMTPAGQTINLGGFSGLWFEGMDGSGNYQFITLPDRGPNGEPLDVDGDNEEERPFALPNYQARVIRFTFNPTGGVISITQQITLTRKVSDTLVPITGLPNIPGVDEEPVDLFGDPLPYDEFGADLEGIVVDGNGNFWMVDEYRPAIYQFGITGTLLHRYVPAGTGALGGMPAGTYGEETLPAVYASRVPNRGFEAIALDTDNNILYAFIQSPLANPDNAASSSSSVIRLLGIDPTNGQPVAEYIYLLEAPAWRDAKVDKIGDAVYAGNGTFYVIERDASTEPSSKKYIFEISLTGATNLLSGSYVLPAASGVTVEALLTVGEAVTRTSNSAESYRMVGIPDGLGIYEAGADDVRLFLNHELGNTTVSAPIVNGNVVTGAFVSEYVLDSGSADVISGDLAFTQVYTITGSGSGDVTANWLSGANTFGRFCSGYLAGPHDGLTDWVYLVGEESSGSATFDGLGGAAVAISNGAAYVLPELGHFAKENVVILPNTGNTTVVFALEDGPSMGSQLYMYVGSKNVVGATPVERAGLVGGELYFFRSTDANHTDEDSFHKGDGAINGEWVPVSSLLPVTQTVATINDATLEAIVQTGSPFNFIRIEDGASDLNQAGVFYFDTTGSSATNSSGEYINKLGRLYRVTMDTIDPVNGVSTLEVLLEGDAGDPIVNPDNLALNAAGQMLIQEDPTGEHQGAGLLDNLGRDSSIWYYDLPGDGLGTDGELIRVAEVNQAAVPTGSYRGLRGNWETSGVIDASDIYGAGTWLLDVQAHSIDSLEASQLVGSGTDLQVVQGGQLLLLDTSNLDADGPTLEQMTPDEIVALGIQPIHKRKVTNLPSIGYLAGDKPEGLTLLSNGSLVVLNDNDFGLLSEDIPLDGSIPLNPNPMPPTLGIISFPAGNGLDASDEDGVIRIQNWPVYGMFLPDGIASFEANGRTYYATANEGDDRGETERVGDLALDPTLFPDAATLQLDENLGRLNVSGINGDLDGDGDYDQLWSYGTRSFTIWDEYGNLVFDSGDGFEQVTAVETPSLFNADSGDPADFDTRSDNKGPEPESVVIGRVGCNTYAFIGLERAGGGVMIYDVTNPTAPVLVAYEPAAVGDISPEGLKFVPAAESPTGKALLLIANEISGTTSIYQIEPATCTYYLPVVFKS